MSAPGSFSPNGGEAGGGGGGGAASAAQLAAALAAQHRVAQERFGWAHDNFIGATPQRNAWSDDWLAFWRDRRLHDQLKLAQRHRLPSRMIDRGERLAADCEAFFSGHRPIASLLHGDLWGGNAAATSDGKAVVFDPAVYAGDRECDIAMTELFGGFPKDFQSAYRAAWALDDGYRVRAFLQPVPGKHAKLFADASAPGRNPRRCWPKSARHSDRRIVAWGGKSLGRLDDSRDLSPSGGLVPQNSYDRRENLEKDPPHWSSTTSHADDSLGTLLQVRARSSVATTPRGA